MKCFGHCAGCLALGIVCVLLLAGCIYLMSAVPSPPEQAGLAPLFEPEVDDPHGIRCGVDVYYSELTARGYNGTFHEFINWCEGNVNGKLSFAK